MSDAFWKSFWDNAPAVIAAIGVIYLGFRQGQIRTTQIEHTSTIADIKEENIEQSKALVKVETNTNGLVKNVAELNKEKGRQEGKDQEILDEKKRSDIAQSKKEDGA